MAERDRVIKAETETRKTLARNLHDGATQLVSAVVTRLDYCKLLYEKEPAKLANELGRAQDMARQAVDEIRTLLFELRPIVLESKGLADALQIFLDHRQMMANAAKLTLDLKPMQPDGEISRQENKVEEALFAIVQEAVNNALKHAQAKNIGVVVEETPVEIWAIITDDGQGFEVAEARHRSVQQGSYGLTNLQERADLIGGELRLESTLGRGTKITLRVSKSKAVRMKKRGTTGPLTLPHGML